MSRLHASSTLSVEEERPALRYQQLDQQLDRRSARSRAELRKLRRSAAPPHQATTSGDLSATHFALSATELGLERFPIGASRCVEIQVHDGSPFLKLTPGVVTFAERPPPTSTRSSPAAGSTASTPSAISPRSSASCPTGLASGTLQAGNDGAMNLQSQAAPGGPEGRCQVPAGTRPEVSPPHPSTAQR
jgi:hypothetical protein